MASRLLDSVAGPGVSRVRVSAAKLGSFAGREAQTLLCVDVRGAAPSASAPQRCPMDLVLIIDVSYSMSPAMEDVRETCRQIFSELDDRDRICLVSFSLDAKVVLPLTTKSQVEDFERCCAQLKEEASTNIEAGLKEGLRQLNTTVAHGGYNGYCARRRPVDEVPSSNTAVAILLSDGQPNGGLTRSEDLLDLAEKGARATSRPVTLHAFGFTSQHAIELMSSLPARSNGPVGSYYYLEQSLDITAAVGDCLGATSAQRVCQGLTLRMVFPDGAPEEGSSGWFGPPIGDDSEDAPLLGIQACERRELGALIAEEQQAQLYVLQENVQKASLQVSWQSQGDAHLFAGTIDLAALQGLTPLTLEEPGTSSLGELGVCAHVLRLEAAAALSALALSPDVADRYQDLHGSVLACLQALQELTEECSEEQEQDALFLEGMLQALERDLGDAIAEPGSTAQRKGVLLAFAAEHFGMRSASSLSRVRTAYASRQQIQTRLRFLQSACGAQTTAKVSCPVQEEGLTADEIACRNNVEEQVCYAMLSNWRECILGVGLYVHPRTCRERRARIPPEVDLVLDYVSAEAYNLGVRSSVEQGGDWDAEEAQEPVEVLRSTVKRRINAWLPLYINATNWAVSRTFAPSAFSLIATQLNTSFQAGDALKVCARLMCCAVVGFVRSPDTWERAKASERSVQMYCDIHRLLLQMAKDYPAILELAQEQVTGFIEKPEMRTRKGTSDLGLLIAYLSLVDGVSWSDMWHVFVPEMVRRAFARMPEAFQPEQCDSLQALVERFDRLEPEHGRVIAFFLAFTSIVSKPSSSSPTRKAECQETCSSQQSFADVCRMYDRRWGQLGPERRSEVLTDVARICRCKSVKDVMAELMPSVPSDEDLGELLLWANKNGHNPKAIPHIPQFPMKEHPLLHNWQRAVKYRQQICAEVDGALASGRPKDECLQLLLDLSKQPQPREEKPATMHRFATREEASAAAAAARRAAEQPKGKGAGKGIKSKAPAEVPATADCLVTKKKGLSEDPFDLQLRLSGAVAAAEDHVDMMISVQYFQDEKPTLVADFRAAIAKETGMYPEQLRLILRGAKHCDFTKRGVTNFTLHDDEPLMDWHLNDSEVVVEVKKKQRAGKNLHHPGNGWFKKKQGRTCTMNIAGAIVKQMIFSKVDQYSVTVEESRIFSLITELCEHYQSDAALLAAADMDALPAAAESRGFNVEVDEALGVTKMVLAQRRVTLLSERDDPDFNKDLLQGEPDPDLDKIPAVVNVPEEAKGSKLIFVLGGDVLRETASLAKVMRSLHQPSASFLRVFHLITSSRHKLHSPSLGFVVRTRDRFGCDIPQLPAPLLERILTSTSQCLTDRKVS